MPVPTASIRFKATRGLWRLGGLNLKIFENFMNVIGFKFEWGLWRLDIYLFVYYFKGLEINE